MNAKLRVGLVGAALTVAAAVALPVVGQNVPNGNNGQQGQQGQQDNAATGVTEAGGIEGTSIRRRCASE
jgi:hypothetical protein